MADDKDKSNLGAALADQGGSQDDTQDQGSGTGMVDAVTGAPADPNAIQVPPEQPKPQDVPPPDVNQAAGQPNLSQALSTLPSQGPTDMPRFQRTVGSTLKGMLLGLATGGIPGAIVGAATPTGIQQVADQKSHFQSAQAAAAVAEARRKEIEAQNYPQQLRDQHDANVLERVKYMTSQYGAPTSVFPNTSEAATEAMNNKAANGGIPLTHIMSDSDNTYVWDMSQVNKSDNTVDEIRQAGKLSGNPALANIDAQKFRTLPKDQQESFSKMAQNIMGPITPVSDNDQRKIQTLQSQRQLQTAQALPDTDPDKASLVKKAQGDIDMLGKADTALADNVDEDARKQFVQGIQGMSLPNNLKATFTNAIQSAKTGAAYDKQVTEVNKQIEKYQESSDLRAAAGANNPKNSELNSVAFDPTFQNPDGSKGANVLMTPQEAQSKGLPHYKVDASLVNSNVAGFNDVQTKLNLLHDVATDPARMSQVNASLAAAMLKHDKGIELGAFGTKTDTSQINAALYKEDVQNANQATRDFVAAYANAHEAITQLPRLQTFGKSSRMTQQQMEAAQNLIPVPGDDANLAETKLHNLASTMSPLRKQIPHMPGAELVPTYEDPNYQPSQQFVPKNAPDQGTTWKGIGNSIGNVAKKVEPHFRYDPNTKKVIVSLGEGNQ